MREPGTCAKQSLSARAGWRIEHDDMDKWIDQSRVQLKGVVADERKTADPGAQSRLPASDISADRQHRLTRGENVGQDRQRTDRTAIEHGATGGGRGLGISAARGRWRCEERQRTFKLINDPAQVLAALPQHLDRPRRARLSVPEDEPRLDGSVPNVALEPEGGVGWLARLDVEPAVASERHPGRSRATGADREPSVAPLPHRAHVVESGTGHEQPRPGIAGAARLEELELLGELQAELSARDDRIDPLHRAAAAPVSAPRPRAPRSRLAARRAGHRRR